MEMNVGEEENVKTEDPVAPVTTEESQVQKKVLLTSVEITDENVALNVIVSFVNIAQKRGAFTIDEAAKIWECIKKFQK
jgi:hypothetical protein